MASSESTSPKIPASVSGVEELLRLLEVDRNSLGAVCGFLPVRMFAQLWGLTERELTEIWRKDPSSPRLTRLKKGRYLVAVDDVPAWIESRRVETPDQTRRRTSVIRRLVSDAP